MESSELAAVVGRLEKLERQNRMMKRAGTAILILAGAVLLMAQAPANKTVEATEFLLRDANGNQRAVLRVNAEGASGLALYDATGKTRALLSGDADGPDLVLWGAGKQSAMLDVSTDVGPRLRLYDASGKPRLMLNMGAEGPGLSLLDAAGNSRAVMAIVEGQPLPFLALTDKDKNVIWKAP